MSGRNDRTYEFADFRLETAERRLSRNGTEVSLSPKAFDLLLVLIENAGHLISKDEIYDKVWADTIVEDANLTVQISALRRAIGSEKIHTVKRHGYRFTPEVVDVSDVVEEFSVEKHTVKRLTIENEFFDEPDVANAGSTAANYHTDESVQAIEHSGLSQDPTKEIVHTPKPNRTSRLGIALAILGLIGAAIGLGGYALQSGKVETPEAYASEIRRLTTSGDVTTAALSPDGRLFVFATSDGYGESLWLGHTKGGRFVELRPQEDIRYLGITFSNDSDHIYYVALDNVTKARNLRRTSVLSMFSETILENVAAPFAISPDEGRVAFVRFQPITNDAELVIADIPSGTEKLLAKRPYNNRFSTGGLSWSPDGQTLAVGAINDDMGIMFDVIGIRASDGSSSYLSPVKWNDIYRVQWQGDGNGLFLIGSDPKGWLWGQIFHISLPSGTARRITLDFHSYLISSLSVSHDGSTVLAVQHQQVNGIWIAPADDPGKAKQITEQTPGLFEGLYGLCWTADGRVIFGAYVGDSQTIWSMNADGTDKQQIVSEGFVDSSPDASTDGRHLVFHSNRAGTFEIWRTDLEGNGLRPITTDTQNYQPTISPDGNWIIYRSWKDGLGHLWKSSTDGGDLVRFTEEPASWPQYSPDGLRVAYATGNRKIRIADSISGIVLSEIDMPPGSDAWNGLRWVPNGNAITIRDSRRGIWRIDLVGDATPYKIAGLEEEKIYNFAWSLDGNSIAITKGHESDDVVLIKVAY